MHSGDRPNDGGAWLRRVESALRELDVRIRGVGASAADSSADAATAAEALADHVAAPDPHPGYLTPAEGNAAYDDDGAAADAQAYAIQRSNHTGSQDHTTISDFVEACQDAIAALLASGTQVSLSYNDAGDALTISATGADAEAMRDAVGAALVGVGNIAVTVNDGADTITISTTATVNSTDAALRDRTTHTGTQDLDTTSDSATRLALTPAERTALAALALLAASPAPAVQSGGTLTLPQSDATNYTDVPGLSVTLPVGTYVLADAYIEVEGTTTSDLTMRFLGGGGLTATGTFSMNGLASGTATVASSITKHALAWGSTPGLIGLATAANPVSLSPTGLIIVTVAGTLKVQARQGVPEATDTKIRNGVLRFVKVA